MGRNEEPDEYKLIAETNPCQVSCPSHSAVLQKFSSSAIFLFPRPSSTLGDELARRTEEVSGSLQ